MSYGKTNYTGYNNNIKTIHNYSNTNDFPLDNSSSEIWFKGNKPIMKRASCYISNPKPNNLYLKTDGKYLNYY